ncbi:MAG: T9SS type A sorting domain-containing protein [Ignavibacteria bacterium]|nr:T9SS type A sorting domain-containing protein [Ignavibacteria bacterium]
MRAGFTSFVIIVLILISTSPSARGSGYNPETGQSATVLLVVPNSYTATPGTATFLGPLANAPRTYQLLINSNQLTGLVGFNLNGLTWRIPVSATGNWPSAEVIYTNYDIYLSGSVAPSERSLTFANNIVGTQTQVRSGELRIAENTYPSGGNPNDFGDEITFTTPWLYNGGNLLIEIRHTGFTGTSRSVDAIGTAISGYGTDFSACWTGNYTGTSGAQGNFGVVRLTADSTLVGISESNEIPSSFKLSQNYPNPFNPSTKISFDIASAEIVTLRIYDVMGREVATLVNENLNPGRYNAVWNASGISSNIYFYKLSAGEFIETKQMMLVK